MYFDQLKENTRKAYINLVEQNLKPVDIGQASGKEEDKGATGMEPQAPAPVMDMETGAAEPPPPPPPAVPDVSAATDTLLDKDKKRDDDMPRIKFGPTLKDVRSKIHGVSVNLAKIVGKLESVKILSPEDVFEIKRDLEMANEKLGWVMDSTDNLRVK